LSTNCGKPGQAARESLARPCPELWSFSSRPLRTSTRPPFGEAAPPPI
jgi:hypothetical protein